MALSAAIKSAKQTILFGARSWQSTESTLLCKEGLILTDLRPTALHYAHHLVEKHRSGKLIGMEAFDGGELSEIEADYFCLARDRLNKTKRLVPA